MYKFFRLHLCIGIGLLLSACSSTVVNTQSYNELESIWQQRQMQLFGLDYWHMKGRMTVVNGAELWAMSVDWQQKGEQFVIFLSGPFGAGKVQLAGSANGVLLKNSDDQIFYAETAEELLLEHTGIAMPLSHLRYWMVGLPHNGNKQILDSSGKLESLSSDDWDINFKRYTQIENNNKPASNPVTLKTSGLSLELPDKIFIHQGDDIKVRVVVSEWLLDET